MERIAKRLTDLIRNTPLLELNNYSKVHNAQAHIIAKLEYLNPHIEYQRSYSQRH